MNILFLGEIVGKNGIQAIKEFLPSLVEEKAIDFVIANGNGTTGGYGLGKNHAYYLHKLGVNVITSGECIFYKKDIMEVIVKSPYLLRGANFPTGTPGRGWAYYNCAGNKLAVLNFMGQSGMDRVLVNNPFSYITDVIKKVKETTPFVVVNFHCRTTAEKQTMFHHINGKVGALLGTGGRVMTADLRVSDQKTVYVTDAGRTGSAFSVNGYDPENQIQILLSQLHERSVIATGTSTLEGVFFTLDEKGKGAHCEYIRRSAKEDIHGSN